MDLLKLTTMLAVRLTEVEPLSGVVDETAKVVVVVVVVVVPASSMDLDSKPLLSSFCWPQLPISSSANPKIHNLKTAIAISN
jgi:hypothetical protein